MIFFHMEIQSISVSKHFITFTAMMTNQQYCQLSGKFHQIPWLFLLMVASWHEVINVHFDLTMIITHQCYVCCISEFYFLVEHLNIVMGFSCSRLPPIHPLPGDNKIGLYRRHFRTVKSTPLWSKKRKKKKKCCLAFWNFDFYKILR